MEHDFLATFPAKTAEYLVALVYLVSFIFMWRYLHPKAAQVQLAKDKAKVPVAFDFQVPDGIWLHPGHAWARLEGNLATVGVDDFGQKLVGDVKAVKLPPVGAEVIQGHKAWSLLVDGKQIDVVAPVNGTVVEVNQKAAQDPSALRDPYGAGWLAKIRPARAEADKRILLKGQTARLFERDAFEALLSRASPELGAVAHDGGIPVHGLAQAIAQEDWAELASEYFLTAEARP